MSPMPHRSHRWAVYVACSLLVAQPLLFYRRVLFHPRMRIPYDIAGFHTPLTAYIARCVRQGVFPFWDPYSYCGVPIHADLQSQLFYPLTWISILLGNLSAGHNLFYWIEWLVPIHMILGGLFTFYLLRLVGVRIPAALFGGTVYQLGGYFASQAQHLGAICAGAWLPLVLLCVWQLSQKTSVRWIAVLGVAVAMTILSGFAATMAVVFAAGGLFAIVLAISRRPSWRYGPALAAAFALGTGIASIQLIPTFQLTGLSVASERALADSTGGGLPVQSLVSLVVPNYYHIFTPFDPARFTLPFNFTFLYAYCGILTLALLLIAPFFRGAPYARWFFGLTILCAVWMVGDATPAYRLVFMLLPRLVRGSLYAEFALLAFCMFAALTAALALDHLGRRAPHWILWCAALLTAADLTHFGANRPMNSAPGSYKQTSNDYEIGGSSEALKRLQELIGTSSPPARVDYLQRDVLAAVTAAPMLRLPSPDGDNPFALKRIVALRRLFCGGDPWDRQLPVNRPFSPLLSMLNVGYLVAYAQPVNPDIRLPVVAEFAGIRLYRTPAVVPRFFLVSRVHVSRGEQDTLSYLARPDFAPAEEAVVEAADVTAGKQYGRGTIRMNEYAANRVDLTVTAASRAFLASSEVLYPGWTATVNGNEARLYMTNGAFRGLFLEPGENHVVMAYRPERFTAAAIVSLIFVIFALTAMIWDGRRARERVSV